MKMFAWISSLIFIGVVVSGCSESTADQSNARSAEMAVNKMAAVQTALDQVLDARNAIKTADDNKLLAVEDAEKKREAVRNAIAMATEESEALKKEAAMRAAWAKKTHDQATETRNLLLKAAMEQSDAKALLAEKEKALIDIRMLNELHQNDAKAAMLGKLNAEKQLAVVLEAERLAALSIHLVTPNADTKHNMQMQPSAETTAESKKGLVNTVAKTEVATKKTVKKQAHKAAKKADLKLASNAQRGHGLAQKCQSCHNFEPNQEKKFGPNLFSIVGQQAGKSQDYKYGASLAKADFTWNEENLTDWICHSGKSIKKLTGNNYASTKMLPQHICGQDAKDVVAYLRTLKSQASIKRKTDS